VDDGGPASAGLVSDGITERERGKRGDSGGRMKLEETNLETGGSRKTTTDKRSWRGEERWKEEEEEEEEEDREMERGGQNKQRWFHPTAKSGR
jgi:hypothetical protein